MIDPAPLGHKVRSLGILDYYWEMAMFISLAHSLFEEYYWRGFIMGELRSRMGGLSACVVGGAVFGIHHIFAIATLFDWPVVATATGCTMVAGFVWSRMRLSGRSIWDCYVSHVFADLAIMWVGYDLLTMAQ